MPELPEVETMRRGIAAIEGRRIRDVRGARCRLRPIKITPRLSDLRRRATGKRIVAVARAGKRVVVELESGDRIVFEPRMTGRLLLAEPPDPEHLRLVFELSGRPPRRLLFWSLRGLATVELMSPRRFAGTSSTSASSSQGRSCGSSPTWRIVSEQWSAPVSML